VTAVAAVTHSVAIDVRPVASTADREAFIRFQWEPYQGNAAFVPPLLMERRDFLNPKKNPFFQHADVELFLARRNGKIVGRIAAIEDRNYNKFHSSKTAYWGLFECLDDVDAAQAMFATVKAWSRARGLVGMLGPMNVSSNYDCGTLLDAFDVTKAVPERVQKLAEKFRKREDLTVRPIDVKDMANEIEKIKRIYNDAWEQNWGAVPMTDDEFHHMAKDMKQLVVPELFLIAEVRGEPVAFAMTLPDVNRALAKVNGRLFPFGLVKLLWHMRKITACRLIALGIRKGFRKRGIDAVLYNDTLKNAQRLGYTDGEVSWTLEDNVLINRAIELMGAKRYKTYRMYEGPV